MILCEIQPVLALLPFCGYTFGIIESGIAGPSVAERGLRSRLNFVSERRLSSNHHPPYVLVVEDNPQVAEVLCAMLEDMCIVTVASDIQAALHQLEMRPPDVVLLDCLLPGGRPDEVVTQAEEAGSIVIPMSGDPRALASSIAQGRTCLAKPFSVALLRYTILTALPDHTSKSVS